jgi:hypothetical protein
MVAESLNPNRPLSGGLAPVAMETFLLAYLQSRQGEKSATQGQIVGWLKAFADQDRITAALKRLIEQDLVALDANKLVLTATGQQQACERFGERLDKKRLETVVWPALALGIAPNTKQAQRFSGRAGGENLRAATLVVLYDLPLDRNTATLAQATAALMVRALAGKVQPRPTSEALQAYASQLSNLTDIGVLRRELPRMALRFAAQTASPAHACDLAAFAQCVQTLANRLTTPPFDDAVAIAQVYDAYAREVAHPGDLASFKQRLAEAHMQEQLALATLDRPQAMDDTLRERSTLSGTMRDFHFILRQEG